MTDDRGLEEDASFTSPENPEPSRLGDRSRRMMVILIGASTILGFVVLALYAYSKGKQEGQSSVPPVIQPKDGPSKIRPKSPGGMKIPDRDKRVFDRMEADPPAPRAELLRPRPEKPIEAPSNIPPREQNEKRQSKPDSPVKAQQPPNREVKPKPSKPLPSNKIASGLRAEENTRSNKVKPRPDRSYRVQIASLRSEKSVRKNWSALNKRHKALLGKLSLFVERKDLGGSRGTYYRMQAGPFETANAARRLCEMLKRLELGCIIVKR